MCARGVCEYARTRNGMSLQNKTRPDPFEYNFSRLPVVWEVCISRPEDVLKESGRGRPQMLKLLGLKPWPTTSNFVTLSIVDF